MALSDNQKLGVLLGGLLVAVIAIGFMSAIGEEQLRPRPAPPVSPQATPPRAQAEAPTRPEQADRSTSARSPNCVEVVGETVRDKNNALAFCRTGLEPGLITGVIAQDSILIVKVGRDVANAMRLDRLSTEQLVKIWMTGWRHTTGRRSVTVKVEWQSVEVARGDTSFGGEDRVTVR